MIEWINITDETPRKDGTEFLAWSYGLENGKTYILKWCFDGYRDFDYTSRNFTHWAKITPPEL